MAWLFSVDFMNFSPVLGAHMSIAKGFANAAEQTKVELDCNAMQIFLKSPRSSASKPLDPNDVQLFKSKCELYGIKFIIGHASYLLNFAKPLSHDDNWQLRNIEDDLVKLNALGGYGLVYHVGKSLSMPPKEALKNLYENLQSVLDIAAKNNVKLLLENCAGQGTEIGNTLEELAEVYKGLLSHPSVQFCIDTCHAFAAGYDISSVGGVKDFFSKIKATIGLDNVACFHFNDSIKPLGSALDRHDNLTKGAIGVNGLKAFAATAVKMGKPLILETPLVNNSHLPDMQILKKWLSAV